MPDVLTTQVPRDVDNVLVRVPSGLRRRVMESAKDHNVSQNTYITASLLFSAVVFGELPRLGIPKNFIKLLAEMDKAANENDAVLGAFNAHDWADVRPILELFSGSGIIDGLKAKGDAVTAETIAFTFHFSKAGLAAWKILGPLFKQTAETMDEGDSLFAMAGDQAIA